MYYSRTVIGRHEVGVKHPVRTFAAVFKEWLIGFSNQF